MCRDKPYTQKVWQLSNKTGIHISENTHLTTTEVQRCLSEAIKRRKSAQRGDSEARADWLKGLAQEATSANLGSDWEATLKSIIKAAEVKQLNARLTGIMSSEKTGLDYIEVPNSTWFYSPRTNKIFEFKKGMFTAHAKVTGQDNKFHV